MIQEVSRMDLNQNIKKIRHTTTAIRNAGIGAKLKVNEF